MRDADLVDFHANDLIDGDGDCVAQVDETWTAFPCEAHGFKAVC